MILGWFFAILIYLILKYAYLEVFCSMYFSAVQLLNTVKFICDYYLDYLINVILLMLKLPPFSLFTDLLFFKHKMKVECFPFACPHTWWKKYF